MARKYSISLGFGKGYATIYLRTLLPEGIGPVIIDITTALPESIATNGVQPDSPTDKRLTEERERERNQCGLYIMCGL
jgi:hypothetical protein